MQSSSQIILERICRALISIIPITGGALDHLTFGVRESLQNKDFLQKLETLEKVIIDLYSRKTSTDEILIKIRETVEFQNTELAIHKYQTSSTTLALQKNNEFALELYDKLVKNNNDLNALSNEIKAIKEERTSVLNELNYLITAIEELNHKTLSERLVVNIDSEKLAFIRNEAINFGRAAKVASRGIVKILAQPYIMTKYVMYPFEKIDEESVFLEYSFTNTNITYNILVSDLDQFYRVHTGRLIPHLYSKVKFKNLCIQIYDNRIEDKWLDISRINKILEALKFDMSDNKTANYHKKAIRFYAIEQLQKKDSICPLLPISASDRRLIDENANLFERAEKSMITVRVLALISFYSRMNYILEEHLLAYHDLKDALNFCVNDKIVFKNVEEIVRFNKNLKLLHKTITEFKNDLKDSILNPLANLQQQQISINNACIEFYKAYSVVEPAINKSIADFIDFDE